MKHNKPKPKNTIGMAEFAIDIFNALTGRGKAERLAVHVYGNRLAVKEGRNARPAIYESLFYGDPRKDARAMGRVIGIVADRIKREFGEEAEAMFRSQVAAQAEA